MEGLVGYVVTLAAGFVVGLALAKKGVL